MTPDELLAAYREAAIIHRDATEKGEARRINRAHDTLAHVRDQLRQAGPEHIRKILTLLDDEDVGVRTWAAVDALELSPEDGLRVLREVASGPPSLTQLDAEMVLEEWEAGRWNVKP